MYSVHMSNDDNSIFDILDKFEQGISIMIENLNRIAKAAREESSASNISEQKSV